MKGPRMSRFPPVALSLLRSRCSSCNDDVRIQTDSRCPVSLTAASKVGPVFHDRRHKGRGRVQLPAPSAPSWDFSISGGCAWLCLAGPLYHSVSSALGWALGRKQHDSTASRAG